MTIRTVTKAAVFLLALQPFLGTGKCLLVTCFLPGCHMVPRGSQAFAESLPGFLSVPGVQ